MLGNLKYLVQKTVHLTKRMHTLLAHADTALRGRRNLFACRRQVCDAVIDLGIGCQNTVHFIGNILNRHMKIIDLLLNQVEFLPRRLNHLVLPVGGFRGPLHIHGRLLYI